MKKNLFYLAFALLLGLAIPFQIFAQSGELVIYSTPITPENTLDQVIAADQASGSPHAIYTLASVDTPYVFDAAIQINNSVTVRGNVGDDGRLPCIQPNVLQDGSVPGHLFVFTKDESIVKVENLYLLGISINNSVNWGDGQGITVNGNKIKTYLDNVVFEQWSQFAVNFSGDWNSFWVTNCKFRNMVNNGSVYTGEAFRQRNDLGTTLVDTLVMKYNTFLAVNAYAMCAPVTGHSNYANFSHNTVVAMSKNPFFNMNITNWECKHNIFYDTYAAGMSNGEFPWWDRIWSGGLGSTIDLDPLNKQNAYLNGIDTTLENWSQLAEASRIIKVEDNIYYRTPAIDDFANEWNKSAAEANDTIHISPWMNDITAAMFADKDAYPNLSDEGNLVGTDPQLGSKYAELLGADGTTVPEENGVGFLPYIKAARGNGGVADVIFSYKQSKPDFSSGNWAPQWPLPEFTDELLKYNADLTAKDGMKYGDPYWFTGTTDVEQVEILPSEFALEQNYPNPFNPTTTIQFAIPQANHVRLAVYNVLGQEVAVLVNSELTAGSYKVNFNTTSANNLSSGLYIYQLQTENNVISKKMMLLK